MPPHRTPGVKKKDVLGWILGPPVQREPQNVTFFRKGVFASNVGEGGGVTAD